MGLVLSIDPGGSLQKTSTAIVIATNVDYAKRTYDLVDGRMFNFADRRFIYNTLYMLNQTDPIETIILEDFLLYKDYALAQTGSRFETVKVIERITYDCERLGLDDRIHMQKADLKDNIKNIPTEHWAMLCLWQPDAQLRRHLIAAYKHLRYYVFWQSNQLKLNKSTKS